MPPLCVFDSPSGGTGLRSKQDQAWAESVAAWLCKSQRERVQVGTAVAGRHCTAGSHSIASQGKELPTFRNAVLEGVPADKIYPH